MTQKQKLLSRIEGGNLFQAVFFVTAFIAAFVTFFAISNVDPTHPFTGLVPFVFAINAVLIAALVALLIRRYRVLTENRDTRGKGRLVRRFLLLFSVSSVLPASIVAIVLGATVTRGLNNWFDTRIGTIVEQTAEIAKNNVDDVSEAIEAQARQVAARIDFVDTASGLEQDPELYQSYLGRQAMLFGFRAVYLVSEDNAQLVTGTVEAPLPFNPPTEIAIEEAANGLVGQTLYEQVGVVTATVKLENPEWAYLYLIQEISPDIFTRLRGAEQAVLDYRQAEKASAQLQTFFAIGYAQIVSLALLLFGRLGLEAGSQIAGPLGRLAKAAELVRDGDLTARVPPPGTDDEIDTLATSFNTMTAQLGAQRSALLSARATSEDRRQFLETLLSQISAGVIRTDKSMTITLANASAEELIGKSNLQGRSLGDILPEFKPYAHAAMRDGRSSDASLEFMMGGEVRHIRLRTLADSDEGCVLTFDDATRIVTAQRHMAWRDVARRIAHEIRNPLTPIQLATERLHRRYGEKVGADDPVFGRSLDTITRQVADIGRMVNEFSNFARMPKPEIRPFDFGAMLEDTVFSQRMVSPEIKFEIEKPETELSYYGDERLLGQAFGNIIKNAAEAILTSPEEDEISGVISVHMDVSATSLSVDVQDNGPGFPREVKDRLLEPYVTTRERGTGLGLAIVNRVVVDHGGTVTLLKRDDKLRGAKVRVILPIEPRADDPHQTQSATAPTLKETV